MGCSRCGKKRTEANAARARKLAQRAAERQALAEQIAKQNGRLQKRQEPEQVVEQVVEQVQLDAPEPEASTEQPPAPDSSSSVDVIDELLETEAEGQEEGSQETEVD